MADCPLAVGSKEIKVRFVLDYEDDSIAAAQKFDLKTNTWCALGNSEVKALVQHLDFCDVWEDCEAMRYGATSDMLDWFKPEDVVEKLPNWTASLPAST